jgi:nuclear pore complex protein Nup155
MVERSLKVCLLVIFITERMRHCAFRLFIRGARVLEFNKLCEICGDFQQLNYAKGSSQYLLYDYTIDSDYSLPGAVELPLACAQVADPDALGWEYWHSGSSDVTDSRYKFWEQRRKCYDLVLDSLSVFEQKSTTSSSTEQGNDLDTVRNHAYELAFSSDDELFHSTLYDWLINRGLSDELLAVCSQLFFMMNVIEMHRVFRCVLPISKLI